MTAEATDSLDVVCLNCGSSSVKGARYRVDDGGERRIAEAGVADLDSTDEVGAAAAQVLSQLAA